MKIASRILSLVILVVVTTFYMGCKKDDDDKKTEEQTQLEKLAGVWTVVSANDGDDRTADFTVPTNMVLTLSGNYAEGGTYNYSLTGSRPDPSPWPFVAGIAALAIALAIVWWSGDRDNQLEVMPGGDLRDHPAERPVRLVLRDNGVGEDTPVVGNQRRGGVVARGFEAEDERHALVPLPQPLH